ncbi:hypothetical protein LEL_07132 [Akanthomyces lecanii RCEF 1005]|uniref:Mg2+ transporter protein, CorA-like/Zinc transport protein ZntB n=1 Tax=Akanthomyces lecanii RCEF 1005 TaxID=1081108 RepID=A0A162LSR7_CORDF|nr:hypothetical protein LEL_07132 [Akanthomyces lecanii RCEF 1005]
MANAQSNASSKSQQYAKQLADFANDNAKSPYIVGDLYLPLSQYLVRAVEEEPDAEVLVCVHPAAGKACGRAQPIIYTRSSELHVLKNWVPHGSTVGEIPQSGVESIVFLCGHQQPHYRQSMERYLNDVSKEHKLTAGTSVLLSLIESLVDESTGYDIYSSPEYSVSSLAYHVDILHRFEHRLRENIHDIEHQSLSWPRSPAVDDVDPTYTNPFQMESENSVKRILIDFKELLARTERLNMRCQNGISMCMSRASVAESQRAIAQAWQVGLLTWIAFLYIPLSFTTSFFGMNIENFGSGTLTLGTWFAISVPLVAFSYAVAMLARLSI